MSPRHLLWAAPLVWLGCGGGDITPPPTTGTLAISTNTTGPEPDADGYAVTIDDGTETAIPASGTLQRDDVEPGNHSIQLTGMAANCTVAGENPRSVEVPAGETVTVRFELTCSATTGSLQITSATSGPSPDADGYTITLDGADRGTLVASGAVTLNGLPAGSHSVGLSGVAGNCRVQGDNPRTVTIVVGASATAAFEIVCAAPPQVSGSLRIITATSGPNPDPDGYAFAVDGGGTQSIGLNATLTLTNLAAGAHQARLSGMAANCTVGGTNPRRVTISAGTTAEVSFAITCTATTGSIEITTTSKGAKPDPDGYTVSLDNGNPQPITTGATVTVPALTAGPHTVALAGLAANCRVDGDNPRTVTIAAGQKVTTSFSVLCPTTATYRATDLGALSPRFTYASAINSAGQVVGSRGLDEPGPGETEAVLWQDGVMIDLNLGYDQSDAAAINPSGQVVGTAYTLGGGSHASAWLWERGVLTRLGAGSANDINPAGQVVGCTEFEMFQCHAALWENGVMTDLGTLGGGESVAHGIDPAGRVVGGSGGRAFLWENGVMTDLNIPGGSSVALKINAAGQVIGNAETEVGGAAYGFLWDKGVTIDLGVGVRVADINAAGQVVGTREVEGTQHAFVWEDGIFTDLPGPSSASGINDEGQVVGSTGVGRTVSGVQLRATLWTPE